MQVSDLDRDTLRRLAELRPEGARVLSVYVNLDPSEFATPAARTTEVHSLTDDAARRAEAIEGLTHDQKKALRDDIQRVRSFLEGSDFSPGGARGVAVFASAPADLFETVRLPRAVDSQVFIDDSPLVEPMADLLNEGRWAVLLVSRRTGRLFVGSSERLEEVESFREQVQGSTEQGGGATARDQRSDEHESLGHLKRTLEVLFKRTKLAGIDALLVGCPEDLYSDVEANMHDYLRQRLAGRIDVEVEYAGADDVLRRAAPLIEEEDRRRERDAFDRLEAGLGTGGRATAGLDDTLAALNERRVEILLYERGFSAPGVVCRGCGWVGPEVSACPVDGGELEHRDDVVESAVELALEQSADMMVPRFHDDLRERGSIAAVLRF